MQSSFGATRKLNVLAEPSIETKATQASERPIEARTQHVQPVADEANSNQQTIQKKQKVVKEPALHEYNFGLQDAKTPLPHGIVQDVTLPERFAVSDQQIQTLEEDGVLHIKGV